MTAAARRPVVVAIDGPAASGKGTLARALGAAFGLRHLDTGLLYRAVGAKTVEAGLDPGDAAAAERIAAQLDAADLARGDLRSEATARAASLVAPHPGVRAALLAYQRAFASDPAGAVLDGRDIGTVVLPGADAKLFVVASAEARARRRHKEAEARGEAVGFEAVLADIRARDARDAARQASPMTAAADAHLIDTTELDIAQAIALATSIVRRCY